MRSGNKQFVNKRLMAGCYSSFFFLFTGRSGWLPCELEKRRAHYPCPTCCLPWIQLCKRSARVEHKGNTLCICVIKCPNWGREIADFSSSTLGQSTAWWDAFKTSWSWLIASSLIATSIRAWLYYLLLATCSSVNPDSDCVHQLGALSLLVLYLTNPPPLTNWADMTLRLMQIAKI